jgi:hypothetical protein
MWQNHGKPGRFGGSSLVVLTRFSCLVISKQQLIALDQAASCSPAAAYPVPPGSGGCARLNERKLRPTQHTDLQPEAAQVSRAVGTHRVGPSR